MSPLISRVGSSFGFNRRVSAGGGRPSPAPAGIYGQFPDSSLFSNGTTSPNITNIWFRRSIIGFTYTYAEITNNGTNPLAGGGIISGLSFYQTNAPQYQPLPNYAVAMMHMPSNSTNSANPTLSNSGRTNFTTVRSPLNFSSGYSVNIDISIAFTTNFVYDGTSALGFIFAWGQCPVNYNASGSSRISNTGNSHYAWTDAGGSWTVNDTASNLLSYRPCLNLNVS